MIDTIGYCLAAYYAACFVYGVGYLTYERFTR